MTTPPDLAMMLDAETRLLFESLPYGRQRRYIESILRAKSAEAREHRIARTVRDLRTEERLSR